MDHRVGTALRVSKHKVPPRGVSRRAVWCPGVEPPGRCLHSPFLPLPMRVPSELQPRVRMHRWRLCSWELSTRYVVIHCPVYKDTIYLCIFYPRPTVLYRVLINQASGISFRLPRTRQIGDREAVRLTETLPASRSGRWLGIRNRKAGNFEFIGLHKTVAWGGLTLS